MDCVLRHESKPNGFSFNQNNQNQRKVLVSLSMIIKWNETVLDVLTLKQDGVSKT